LWFVAIYASSASEEKQFLAQNNVTSDQVATMAAVFLVIAAVVTWITVRNFRAARIPPAPPLPPQEMGDVPSAVVTTDPAPAFGDPSPVSILRFMNQWDKVLALGLSAIATATGIVPLLR
jgi:hypothetical protein